MSEEPNIPNRFTRVPEREVPPPPAWMRPVVWIADAFMLAMISRPATGSLSKTWITPATIGLCAAVGAVGIPLGILGFAHAITTGGSLLGVASLGLLALASGSLCVLAVAVAQRRAGPPHGGTDE